MSSTPYRVMVVEDETALLENTVRRIEAFSSRFKVVATASDGQQALERLAEHKPQIIFTDIRMPVMDGLTFIQKAREDGVDAEFVILSGYSDFQYAKTAMEYGVRHYLLKPMSKETLYDVLIKLATVLDDKAGALIQGSLAALLHSGVEPDNMEELGTHPQLWRAMLFLGNYSFRFRLPTILEESYAHHWHALDLPAVVAKAADALGLPLPIQHPSTFYNEKYLIYDTNLVSFQDFEALLQKLSEYLPQPGTAPPLSIIWTAEPVSPQDMLPTLRAIRAYYYDNYRPWHPLYLKLPDMANRRTLNRRVSAVKIDVLLQCFRSGSASAMQNALQTTLQNWVESGLVVEQFVQNVQFLLISLRRERSALYTDEWRDLMEVAEVSFSLAESLEVFSEKLFDLLYRSFMQPESESSPQDTVPQVKAYIDENYSSPIGLVEIAERFHLSHSHLSKQYKQLYGQSPIHYLITLRIERAKELMEAYPDMELRQIGELVGYTDQFYFSKLFKKYTGTSPTEYRKTLPAQ